MPNPRTRVFKLGVFGPPEVGKTSLLLQCRGLDPFQSVYDPTIEDFQYHGLMVDNRFCNVEFLDTGGSEVFQDMQNQWTKQCEALIFVYDTSDVSTFEVVQQRLSKAQTCLSEGTIPMALIANHKQSVRKVAEKDGRQVADAYNATYWETSARDTNGFVDACINLLRELGAGRDCTSVTTEDSVAALKQSRSDWKQSILQAWRCISVWVCATGTR